MTATQQQPVSNNVERVPPQNIQAEQAYLGSLLLGGYHVGETLALLKPRDYYRPQHEVIHNAMLALFAEGQPVDKLTVEDYLVRTGQTNLAGGPDYLNKLIDTIPIAANADHYAGIVGERAEVRRVIRAATRAAQDGFSGAAAIDIVNRLQAELADAVNLDDDSEAGDIGNDWAEYEAELAHIQEHGSPKGVLTGFSDLDTLTNGLHPGQLIIVAGRPAMGKTTFGVDIVRHCSIRKERPAAFFSLEMNRRELQNRIMSAQARIAMHHLQSKGLMTDEDWQRFKATSPRVKAAPLHVDANPNQTVAQIKAKCRRLKQQGGLDLVAIDYLQLLQSDSAKPENRQVEVSRMSRALKLMAKELQVPVVVLAQLNRGPEQRQDKRPVPSDLRESGSLEQDADLVLLLHREDAYERESPRAGEADLIVGKNRHGALATITVAAQMHYARFVDLAQS